MDDKLNNDDILRMASEGKHDVNEYEKHNENKGNLIGALVAVIIGAFLLFFELGIKKTLNLSLACVIFVAAGAQLLFEGIKNKSVWKIVFASILLVSGVSLLIAAIGKVIL